MFLGIEGLVNEDKNKMAGIFISYAREDIEKAIEIEMLLKKQEIRVWRDQNSIYAGDQWPKAIGEGIDGQQLFLLLWSKNSAGSYFVELEWATALVLKKTIVPVFLDDTPLPAILSATNGVFYKDFDRAVQQILDTLNASPASKQDRRFIEALDQNKGKSIEVVLKQIKSEFLLQILLNNERIEKRIAQIANDVSKLKQVCDLSMPLEFSYYMKEWAEKYGFTPDDVKSQFTQWTSEVKDSQDNRTLGLREFYLKNFFKSAEHFEQAAIEGEIRRKALIKKIDHEDLATYENWKDAGNALCAIYKFREALVKYRQAEKISIYENYPQQWAEIKILIGNTQLELGIRVTGIESISLLSEATTTYYQALRLYNRKDFPSDWAIIQNNLGYALQAQSIRTSGEPGARLLDQAVEAHQKALEVYTKAELPIYWAMTQNNLGATLQEQGIRTSGEPGVRLLGQAVDAFQKALEVYTKAELPMYWAMTQNNLGATLQEQGIRTDGEQGVRLLGQSVEAFQKALEVRTKAELPQDWAMTQNNLGITLQEQGIRTAGEPGVCLLDQAIDAYQKALEVRTKAEHPQQWAGTQNNLGNALLEQGIRTDGESGARLLDQAVEAFQKALEVRTNAELPQDWAKTQNNLGNAFKAQGIRTNGESGARLLDQAIEAFQKALEVRTKAELPQDWAMTQNNLGITLLAQGIRTGGEPGARLLDQAVEAHQKALEVYTKVELPQQWATTQSNLGNALQAQGILTDGEPKACLLSQAVEAYQKALEIRTFEHLPVDWAQTQGNLALLYESQENWNAAIDYYQQVFKVYPIFAANKLASLYHDRVFRFDKALEMNLYLYNSNPKDLDTRLSLIESYFTTSHYSEGNQYVEDLKPDLIGSSHFKNLIILQVFEIANFVGLNHAYSVEAQFLKLNKLIGKQAPDYKMEWNFVGTKYFIRTHNSMEFQREWLLSFFTALEKDNRDDIQVALKKLLQTKRK